MQKKTNYTVFIPSCILTIAFIYVQVMTDLKLPEYMQGIVNDGIAKGDMGVIKSQGLQMILVAFIGVIATIFASLFAARIAAGVSRNLRGDVFEKVEGFSVREFSKFSTASLITRNTNDIQQIQMFIFMMLRMVASAPIMAIGGIYQAIKTSKEISWILAVSIPLALCVIFGLMFVLVPIFRKVQGYIDRLNKVSRENLTGTRVIRAFRNEKKEEDKFDDANKTLTDANIKLNRIMVLLMPVTTLILNFTQLGIVWFGAKSVSNYNMQIGDIMAFINYSMQVLFSFIMMSMISVFLPRAIVSWKRIREVMNTKVTIKDKVNAVETLSADNNADTRNVVESVAFNHVSFSYPGAHEKVLTNIHFTAKKGEIVAFIGSTGCGKSTLVNLIPRFYDTTEGEILINGVNIKNLKLDYLHDLIGYIPQKAVLFSGSIESNLKLGNQEATEEEMKVAAQISQSKEFIEAKEEGYKSEIAQGGQNVSGGQKQRLSIARALIKQPDIYIFDDSFSALDFKTDTALRHALAPYVKKSITFIVAQRITTIMNADRIIVLEDGEVVGNGTHKELLRSCNVYKEIASSQLSKEELENA